MKIVFFIHIPYMNLRNICAANIHITKMVHNKWRLSKTLSFVYCNLNANKLVTVHTRALAGNEYITSFDEYTPIRIHDCASLG